MIAVPEIGEESDSKRRYVPSLTFGGKTGSIWSLVLAQALSKLDCIISFFKQIFQQILCAFIINM